LDLTSSFHGPVAITVEEGIELPEPTFATELRRNFPNPFNPETTIQYSLREDVDKMELKVYNVLGQVVKTLKSGPHAKGDHKVVWDGKTDSGKSATSGIYFYQMTTPNYSKIHKMMLLK
ncbi:MAG: FlgD immunoglobulin-like domain containing protein, partial [Candidatus Cloacimonas sp.]|nr:T9SS type A sorting domain-containing protein [Candidatus Cloacimonadota bacterium]